MPGKSRYINDEACIFGGSSVHQLMYLHVQIFLKGGEILQMYEKRSMSYIEGMESSSLPMVGHRRDDAVHHQEQCSRL